MFCRADTLPRLSVANSAVVRYFGKNRQSDPSIRRPILASNIPSPAGPASNPELGRRWPTRSVVLHASITSLITPSRHLCIVHYQKDQSPLSSVSDQ
ncbi:hypothetical protein E4U23_003022 [Claviceps purpurea]|nr:hypothetical protein E4U23_003022 [Claviceps purpurea]